MKRMCRSFREKKVIYCNSLNNSQVSSQKEKRRKPVGKIIRYSTKKYPLTYGNQIVS